MDVSDALARDLISQNKAARTGSVSAPKTDTVKGKKDA